MPGDGAFEFLDILDDLRRIPATLKAEATNFAVKLGIDAFPEIFALVKKGEGSKWELVAVALDRALLPEPSDGALLVSARLDRAQMPPAG